VNSKYIRGRRAEYRVIKKLKADGYTTIRSAGSKGLWDVIAYNWDNMSWLVIQVKIGKKPSLREMTKLRIEHVPFALKQIWIVKDRQKEIGIITIE